MKNKTRIGGIIALIIIALVALFCWWLGKTIENKLRGDDPNENTNVEKPQPNQPTTPVQPEKIHLAPGNPSNADTSNQNNYLLINDFYALSYNRQKGISNWVSWRLTKSDFGQINRQNDFRPDDRLPDDWTRILPSDYSGSGFDRGHLCPSADRSSSIESNSATFLMTNMSPQTHDLNAGPWEKLESYSRSLARRNNTLYIIAGNYGTKGTLKNKITVPTNFWKIIVVLPNNADISTISAKNRIIAVDMPNVEGLENENWRKFTTTVRNIEQKTGNNFLSNLPQNVQDALEIRIDASKN